jgi:hypothetical protein
MSIYLIGKSISFLVHYSKITYQVQEISVSVIQDHPLMNPKF